MVWRRGGNDSMLERSQQLGLGIERNLLADKENEVARLHFLLNFDFTRHGLVNDAQGGVVGARDEGQNGGIDVFGARFHFLCHGKVTDDSHIALGIQKLHQRLHGRRRDETSAGHWLLGDLLQGCHDYRQMQLEKTTKGCSELCCRWP